MQTIPTRSYLNIETRCFKPSLEKVLTQGKKRGRVKERKLSRFPVQVKGKVWSV